MPCDNNSSLNAHHSRLGVPRRARLAVPGNMISVPFEPVEPTSLRSWGIMRQDCRRGLVAGLISPRSRLPRCSWVPS